MQVQTQPDPSPKRIGLALSGGGFRASIFHLGVIRRLEELEIMQDVNIISAVSGGSILAAFYACEMENQLRKYEPHQWREPAIRIEAYKEVAKRFLDKVDLNMRSRALVFTPFYHLPLFLYSIISRAFRQDARSVLIQKEYDQHFYQDCTLDQLPAVSPERAKHSRKDEILTGPKLLLNTTSLMTGERREFSRDANTRLAELRTSNKNVLKLSRVVGASAGVPGLFPPTSICGELLVDGGVSDNQGIEGLLGPILRPVNQYPLPSQGNSDQRCHDAVQPPPKEENVVHFLLISDACQQLELKHGISSSVTAVLSRVNDILQHQVRTKLLNIVDNAYNSNKICFAFVHLLLNLKDAGIDERVPAEYIEGIARTRTDLDQFSYVEREALMYHGYTLIDAMVKYWCTALIHERFRDRHRAVPPLRRPPLFTETHTEKQRDLIKKELAAGARNVFLLRTWEKYGRSWKTWTFWLLWPFWLIGVWGAFWFSARLFDWPGFEPTKLAVMRYIAAPIPVYIVNAIEAFAQKLPWPAVVTAIHSVHEFVNALVLRISELLAVLILVGVPFYVTTFFVWAGTRHLVRGFDLVRYRKIAGASADPDSLDWVLPETPKEPTPAPEVRPG
jgi:predicted acylesterase/phospholipase RssA